MTQDNVIVTDADIWMDYLSGRRPGNTAAKRFFEQARRHDIPLVVPPHCLGLVFFLVQKELKDINRQDGKMTDAEIGPSARAVAWAAVDFILETATVDPSDQMDALFASKNRSAHGDYEDNLVVACAQRTKARLLVTNDEKIIRHSPVATMTAEDAAALLASE